MVALLQRLVLGYRIKVLHILPDIKFADNLLSYPIPFTIEGRKLVLFIIGI